MMLFIHVTFSYYFIFFSFSHRSVPLSFLTFVLFVFQKSKPEHCIHITPAPQLTLPAPSLQPTASQPHGFSVIVSYKHVCTNIPCLVRFVWLIVCAQG